MTPLRFAVVGDPIAHSKSPAMHAAAYRALGMPHTYEAIRATAEDLPAIVARLRAGDLAGVNVTVPHKERVLALADAIDPSAAVCGAANTLVARDGVVRAHNTDAPALAAELALLGPDVAWRGATAVVLGSGGAARSAIAALALDLRVARVVVRARADAAAREAFVASVAASLARAGAACEIVAAPLAPASDERASDERAAVAVVQATTCGMTGAAPGDVVASAVAWEELGARAVALDVVYAPPETPFLRAARARGLRAANGAGMLARQGALAFELWLGVGAPYSAMASALG